MEESRNLSDEIKLFYERNKWLQLNSEVIGSDILGESRPVVERAFEEIA